MSTKSQEAASAVISDTWREGEQARERQERQRERERPADRNVVIEALKWIRDQRWAEDADLDDICTRAERALQSQPARLSEDRDAVDEMRRSLLEIIQTPAMPFPDPGAHSWRVYGEAVYRAYCTIQNIAHRALQFTRAKESDSP